MHILISEFMDAPAVEALRRRFDVRYEPDLVERREALLQAAAAADGLIVRNRSRVDAGLLAAAPRLRAVGRLGVGLDNIDLDGCAARGIAVVPATGANARAVAEYVIGAVLALLREHGSAEPEQLAALDPADPARVVRCATSLLSDGLAVRDPQSVTSAQDTARTQDEQDLPALRLP